MTHTMAALVGQHRIAEAGVAQQGNLALIQPLASFQLLLQVPQLPGLAFQVGIQVCDRLLDHLHLGQQEIGEVVVVTLAQAVGKT